LRDNELEFDRPLMGGASRPPAFRFVTLGRLALHAEPDGAEVLGAQRRKLALLAYLALASRPVSRDTLVEMFWGDETESRARHSLSNALSYLRRVLGPESIAVRRAEVSLSAGTPLQVDARDLLAAGEARDSERAIALYGGAFLDGVYVPGSESFDQWVTGERSRLELAFTRACDAVCMTAARAGDWERCATVARRWLEASPLSPEAALHLLNSLRAARTPAARRAALAEYQRLTDRLAREYATTPHVRVQALAEQIAARVEADRMQIEAAAASAESIAEPTAEPTPAAAVQAAPPAVVPIADERAASGETGAATSVSAEGAPPAHSPRRRIGFHRRWRFPAGLATLTVAAVVVFAVVQHVRAGDAAAATTRPLIAVTDIANLRGDTASEWLQDGLAQMIAAELGRSADVEVVTPARVRETRARAEDTPSGPLPAGDAIDIARRLGATLAVRGGFTHGDGTYVLDLDVRDVRTGRSVRAFTLTGADPMAVADQAAGRILAWSVSRDARPRFAEIETSNMAAYQHFVRGLQADAEGRPGDAVRELDAAVALDSGFASALLARASYAHLDGDTTTIARLQHALTHARLTERDALEQAIDSADHNGELARSLQLARELVQRYPHDPRSYSRLAGIYGSRGDWTAYEQTAERQLALDSLANEAGDGPCVPCAAYVALVDARTLRGDLAGAEAAARRWVALQPDLPGAWTALAEVLGYAGRYDGALDAERRATLLAGGDPMYALRTARELILARRFDAADSLARTWHDDPSLRAALTDIRVLGLREHGELRASIRATHEFEAAGGSDGALTYEEMDARGRLGDFAGAQRVFETEMVPAGKRVDPVPLRGDYARWFTWTRALEANAIAGAGDTLRLHAIADSMRVISARSYYGRDWRLYHHVLGRIDMLAHRYADAEREFQAARWGVAGWTETVAWLARAQLAQYHARDAIVTLRQGYEGPLDAMGRYEPRSELDYLMAVAFRDAGMRDSAAVYGAYVRRAWRNADPEIRRQLDSL
jgi:DNA-binding SARP family transcriptional activator/TolB-like protein